MPARSLVWSTLRVLPLPDFSEDLETRCEEVLAALPETIPRVDAEQAIVSVNRLEPPISTKTASSGAPLTDVLEPDARRVVYDIVNAKATGGSLADVRSGPDLYGVTAEPLESAALTLLIFRNTTTTPDRARSIQGMHPD